MRIRSAGRVKKGTNSGITPCWKTEPVGGKGGAVPARWNEASGPPAGDI